MDVKPGGEVCEQGVLFELSVGEAGREAKIDLSRDVIKSADASITIPEIDLELAPGTLGGLFTTVEGLLSQTRDHLTQANPLAFTLGDAGSGGAQKEGGAGGEDDAYAQFITKLTECIEGKRQFRLVLRDPTGNSYVQALDETDEGWGVLGATVTDAARDHDSYVQHGMQVRIKTSLRKSNCSGLAQKPCRQLALLISSRSTCAGRAGSERLG